VCGELYCSRGSIERAVAAAVLGAADNNDDDADDAFEDCQVRSQSESSTLTRARCSIVSLSTTSHTSCDDRSTSTHCRPGWKCSCAYVTHLMCASVVLTLCAQVHGSDLVANARAQALLRTLSSAQSAVWRDRVAPLVDASMCLLDHFGGVL
jgi:hypothetical protein